MHRGLNQDYQRAPVPPPRYCPAAKPGAGPPFPGPFNTHSFPPHFPNPVSFPRSIPPPGFQGFGTESSYKAAAPAGWMPDQNELQNLEVKKKAEEFLRMLETDDWIKPSGESGDTGMRRVSADGETERHASEKHSRARSRSKSRGRSRGKSRAHSRGRSRARSRSRSRSRGKSRTRAKSRSRSRGRSLARSKSQPRLCKESQRSVLNTTVTSVSARVPNLFQNLKQVLQNKELVNTFMSNKTQEVLLKQRDAERDDPNVVLPHERESGSDSTLRILSWNNPGRNPQTFSSIEDEEEFLYGDEDKRKKPQAVTVPLAQTRPAENLISSHCSSKPLKVQPVASRRPLTPDVSAEECERVKNMLKTIGMNLSQTDINKMAIRLKQKQEEQRDASVNTTLRATLETLLNRSKVQKSDDGNSSRSESSHSHRGSAHGAMQSMEKEHREKQIQKKRKEYLVKELEGLLKHEGSGDLIPVIGFFCQRCEEFFGDLSSAEGHKHTYTQRFQNISHAASSVTHQQQIKDHQKPREDSASVLQNHDAQLGKSRKKKKKKEKKKKDKKKVKVKTEKN